MKLLLNYAVVGMTEVFSVEIDDGLPLWKLIEAIAKAMGYNEKVSNLQLFLAKKDGAWLNGAGTASVALEEDGTPRGFGKKMDPSLYIKNPRNFGVDFQPGEGVHVLVVVPQQEGQSVELPNVIWYGSPGSTGQRDGVNLEDERTLSRNTLTNDVINRLDKNHVLLVKSPEDF